MPEGRGDSLAEILGRVRLLFLEELDFASTEPEIVPEIVRRLTAAARCFNLEAITDYGGRTGQERTPGLVEQAIGAAFQTFAGEDPHPHPFQKAAMLLRGITQGHPFADGNKRTGFLLVIYYLAQVGYALPESLPQDEVVEFCLQVSAGTIRDTDAMADQLARFWREPPVT